MRGFTAGDATRTSESNRKPSPPGVNPPRDVVVDLAWI
jgi:hypothetical protein